MYLLHNHIFAYACKGETKNGENKGEKKRTINKEKDNEETKKCREVQNEKIALYILQNANVRDNFN